MDDAPEAIRCLPKNHPATWLRVLSAEIAARKQLELHVIVLRNNVQEDHVYVSGGVTFHVVRVPRLVRAPSLFWVDTWAIRRKLKQLQPDLIHAWGAEKGAALVAGRLGIPYLVTVQGLLSWYRKLIPLNTYDHFTAVFENVALSRARFITTECTFAMKYLSEKYPRATVIQAEHAPNWHFHKVVRRPQTSPIRLIFVGSPCYRKGLDLLLHALNGLVGEVDFVLKCVGGGSEYVRSFGSQLKPELLNRLEIIPGLPPEGVAKELEEATMLVLPTRADTSPNAVKEAVVAGVPVVASGIGGILDYVVPDKNGFLFESGNAAALVDALRRAIGHPLFTKGLVDAKCLAQMRSYLSPSQMGNNFQSAYIKVMEGTQK